MTYRNDYRHGTRTYKDVDAAAINFQEMRNETIRRFINDNAWFKHETLGEYIARTHTFY